MCRPIFFLVKFRLSICMIPVSCVMMCKACSAFYWYSSLKFTWGELNIQYVIFIFICWFYSLSSRGTMVKSFDIFFFIFWWFLPLLKLLQQSSFCMELKYSFHHLSFGDFVIFVIILIFSCFSSFSHFNLKQAIPFMKLSHFAHKIIFNNIPF